METWSNNDAEKLSTALDLYLFSIHASLTNTSHREHTSPSTEMKFKEE
jgi:hypothetical protein